MHSAMIHKAECTTEAAQLSYLLLQFCDDLSTNVRTEEKIEFSFHGEFQNDSSFQTGTESQKSGIEYKC